MKRYNPSEIEPKWQQIWADDKRYEVSEDAGKRKYYVSGMFPYPSAAGMHVGHTFEHAIVDAVARFQRAQGANVLNPMGWDAFGLPAENYAIKTGTPPAKSTADNVAGFTNQLKRLGASIDWSREINTSSPEYYKWTQWIFTQLFERGLAYQKEANQWWCPQDMTVLANEQVENGKCWRCGSEVEKKSMKQWFFKITDYADALLDEIPALDWPDKIKTAQTNWIGRSEGAEIDFAIHEGNKKPNFVLIHGFTGRADKNWLPWVSTALTKAGYTVQVPQLPNPDEPAESEQVQYVLDACNFDENTVLVGHSLGGAVAMKVLQKLTHSIRKLVLVAPVIEPAFRNENYENENPAKPRNFVHTFDLKYDYEKVKSQAADIVILSENAEASKRKPYLDYLADKLAAPLREADGQKSHFTGDQEPFVLSETLPSLTVFTTRPDTIFGATFMVIAPEHPLIKQLVNSETRETVEQYVAKALKKSEIERMAEGKEKTGVFTGSHAINPATGEKIPIWVADYVLWGYGTGAIMAVPAHDERDFEFAEKFDLPVRQVVAEFYVNEGVHTPRDDVETQISEYVDAIITDGQGNYLVQIEDENNAHFVGGGIDDNDESLEAAITREIREETGITSLDSLIEAAPKRAYWAYRDTKRINKRGVTHYYEAVVNRQADRVENEADSGLHENKWVAKDDVLAMLTWESHRISWNHYLAGRLVDNSVREGVLVGSGSFNGIATSDAREEVVAWLEQQNVGRAKTTYKMRDWLVSRQRYWGAPIPIVHCEKDGAVAVPKSELPVLLPEVEDFEPKGESVLASVTDWVETTCPTCGGPAKRETDTMDGYACSSWYLLRYTDPHNDEQAWSPEAANYWTPLDMYVGGDHAVAHLLYVRFWNHVFYDMGLVPSKEPVKKLVYHGLIGAEDGRKMSKSLGNVIDPLEIVDQGYGADALRTFELFLGPINENSQWSSKGIAGVYRFLNRAWTLTHEYIESDKPSGDNIELTALRHRTVKKVTTDIHRLSFNTAIAALMEYVNELYKMKTSGFSTAWKDPVESLVQLLAVFAPHMSAELWQQLGHSDKLDFASWPEWDDALTLAENMTIVVQVNGKVRAKLSVAADASEDEIKELALAGENIVRYTENKKPTRVVYVPGRLLNVVI